ncbi:hypothetical protein D9619_010768 [Psilocybe cf. subviscida]|uniref:30S ribosomal protein S15 n=1 Tax=Psilocybe cf. subviscida TaxID=2480587 RepID=A0A8H5B8N5_9AGAR|nr:hypothetical protein D9619_010768 [Psilocybe cf. subviscida]
MHCRPASNFSCSSFSLTSTTSLTPSETVYVYGIRIMFRLCLSTGSRSAASTSQGCSLLHTSAVLNAAKAKRSSLRTKKLNIAQTVQRRAEAAAARPSIVLGTRPGEEDTKWKNCDLYKILVDEEALHTNNNLVPEETPVGTVELPQQFGFGVGEVEKEVLFKDLPVSSAGMATEAGTGAGIFDGKDKILEQELAKSSLLAKALDLRNANAGGIAFENRRRIVRAFSTPEKPFDTGRTEVQIALLTYKIRNLWKHLTTFKRDVANRRALRQCVHDRAKLLKYLKGVSLDRYDIILERVALDPQSVEGELVI